LYSNVVILSYLSEVFYSNIKSLDSICTPYQTDIENANHIFKKCPVTIKEWD